MTEEPLWITISTIIFGSGVAVALLTKFYDRLAKKREETLHMAKYRMDRVDKKFDDYIELTNYANEVASFSKNFSNDDQIGGVKLFLSLMRFANMHDKFVSKGEMLLIDLDAEAVISNMSHTLAKQIKDMFQKEEDYWKFRELTLNLSIPAMLKEVREPYSDYSTYYDIIVNWFSKQNNSKEKQILENIGHSIDELLLYEMNLVFEEWYNNKVVSKDVIKKGTLDYVLRKHEFPKGKLHEAYPRYYKKLFHH